MISNLLKRECLEHDNKQIILVCYNQYCKSKRLACKNCLNLHSAHTNDLIDDDQIEQKVQKFQQKYKQMIKQLNEKFEILTSQYRKLISQIENKFYVSIEKLNGIDNEQFNLSINQLLIEDEQQQNCTNILMDGYKYFEDKIIQCQIDVQLKEFNSIKSQNNNDNSLSNQQLQQAQKNNSYQNYSENFGYNSRMYLRQQQQIYQVNNNSQEIQEYVYGDLNNFMEVLANVKQTFLFFKNQMDNPFISLSLNRLIQQINLSNKIHFDCSERYKNKDQEYIYQREKEQAKYFYNQLLKDMNITNFNQLQHYLQIYEQNFDKVNYLKQIPLLETSERSWVSKNNQNTIQELFGAIKNVDNKKSEIRKYVKLDYNQIKENIKQREIGALEFFQKNFSKRM